MAPVYAPRIRTAYIGMDVVLVQLGGDPGVSVQPMRKDLAPVA
jgi:hypothetical protein